MNAMCLLAQDYSGPGTHLHRTHSIQFYLNLEFCYFYMIYSIFKYRHFLHKQNEKTKTNILPKKKYTYF